MNPGDAIDIREITEDVKRYVKYYDFGDEDKGENYKVYKGTGTFLAFGIDFIELDGGNVNFSTIIIELPDGSLLNIYVDLVKFIPEEKNGTIH